MRTDDQVEPACLLLGCGTDSREGQPAEQLTTAGKQAEREHPLEREVGLVATDHA